MTPDPITPDPTQTQIAWDQSKSMPGCHLETNIMGLKEIIAPAPCTHGFDCAHEIVQEGPSRFKIWWYMTVIYHKYVLIVNV